jgi:hypothetical protein
LTSITPFYIHIQLLAIMKVAAILAIPAILANAATIGLQQQNANVSDGTTPLPRPQLIKST